MGRGDGFTGNEGNLGGYSPTLNGGTSPRPRRARLLAGYVRNRKPARGSYVTRYEVVHGAKPNLARPSPLIFCTQVRFLDDKEARGPSGTPRSRIGEFVGVQDGSYLVQPFKPGTVAPMGKALVCRDVTPVNEHELVCRGHVSSARYVSTASGSNGADAPAAAGPPMGGP